MSTRAKCALAAILAAVGVASVWGITADLQSSRSATEQMMVDFAVKFASGDFNPHYFYHPPLFAYGLFVLYGALYVIGRLFGAYHSSADFERLFFVDPSIFYFSARLVVLGLAMGGVLLLYRIVQKLYGREDVALLSAGFWASSSTLILRAHYASTDVPMMFMAFAAMWKIADVLRGGTLSDYLWSGFLIGVAAAVKYNAAWLGSALILAHFLSRRRAPLRLLAAGVVLSAVGFFAGCPYALLDHAAFLRTYNANSQVIVSETIQFAGLHVQGTGWRYLWSTVFPSMVGAPLTWLGTLGFIYAAWRREPEDILLAILFLSYSAYLGSWKLIKGRYFIHIVPFFLVVGARTAAAAAYRLPARARGPLLAAAFALLVAAPWRVNIEFDRRAARPPMALEARRWIEQNIPAGTPIVTFSEVALMPNAVSLARRLDDIQARKLGPGARVKRMMRHASAFPVAYDVRTLPFAWYAEFSPDQFDFAALRRAGVRRFILTDETDQYLADPKRYPAQVALIDAVRQNGRLVQEFRETPPIDDLTVPIDEYAQLYELRR